MKLTPEQIRERVKVMAGPFTGLVGLEGEIIKIIEDATGEKLPEPFDENNVEHLSVWKMRGYPAVVLFEDYKGEWQGIWADDGKLSDVLLCRKQRHEVIECLRKDNGQYLGQHKFQAGLPGGAK